MLATPKRCHGCGLLLSQWFPLRTWGLNRTAGMPLKSHRAHINLFKFPTLLHFCRAHSTFTQLGPYTLQELLWASFTICLRSERAFTYTCIWLCTFLQTLFALVSLKDFHRGALFKGKKCKCNLLQVHDFSALQFPLLLFQLQFALYLYFCIFFTD